MAFLLCAPNGSTVMHILFLSCIFQSNTGTTCIPTMKTCAKTCAKTPAPVTATHTTSVEPENSAGGESSTYRQT
ncbi:hypothetical protein DFH08DRAFT_349634 [Mycena albidolilacea]|uniref:Secreted protein n=1 Tax=Mycena albidolilacea TaxID=1033008 RepID=A0AAD7EGH1_9AGAR|nr:hypothetical protein DFH08DRAFT_349634 [Mycena albidolilacea]